MKRSMAVLSVCLVAACGGGGGEPGTPSPAPNPPAPNPTPTPTPTPPPGNADNLSFANLLNDVRVANGAGTVTFDARLGNAAQGHANDMLVNNYFSHTGLNGSSPGDRMKDAGYNWRTYGENIARGQRTQAEAMEGWTNSPGHHANNINPNFEDFGLGKAGTGFDTRWVLVLGRE